MRKLIISMLVLLFTLSFSLTALADRGRGNAYGHMKQAPGYYGQGYRYKYFGHRPYHPKNYRGHWMSWREWHDHYDHHRNWYRGGRYYHEGNQLYFEFENEDGRFVFSIGR